MSEANLEYRLMNIPLSETTPKTNYSRLFREVMRDEAFKEITANLLAERPIPSKRPQITKRGLKTNAAKLIVAHILYNRFAKYRDKHFGPALFQYSADSAVPHVCSLLNKETGNKFVSVYAYFYNCTLLKIDDVICQINQGCQMNIVYTKNHEGGLHRLKDYGITNPEFLELYKKFRRELMRDPRTIVLQAEAHKLLGAPEFKHIKAQFGEAVIDILLHDRMTHSVPEYKNNELGSRVSKINRDSNNLFYKASFFFSNHADIFGDFKYACDFIDHCGFKIFSNRKDVWNKIETIGAMDELEDKQASQENDSNAAYSAARLQVLESCLCALPPRTQKILQLRYGLSGLPERSLRAIGRAYNLTPERVRQIQIEAIAKLKKRVEVEQQAYA